MNNTPFALDIDGIMKRAVGAAAEFRTFNQQRTDAITRAVYEAGFNNRFKLAQMACDETKLGVVKDKVMKNIIATRFVYYDIRDLKTCDVISEDLENEMVEIAQPIGPIFCVTPVTNPTSTVLFKILIAMKTRNPIIIRPHGSAKKCSAEAARVCYEAALAAGAPEHCIQWVTRSTVDETLAMMSHKKTALVLATGSVSLVSAAYKSGNPAIGVGPGNVPCYIGESADFRFAVDEIFKSKTFDNGTICASEQAVVVKRDYADHILDLFREKGAYVLNDEEIPRLEKVAYNREQRVMNASVIGQPATKIAHMAGIDVPPDTSLLIAPLTEIGWHAPLSLEILAPILAFYVADDFEGGIELCRSINSHGGLGHTASIFSTDEERIEYFTEAMNAGRILVNQPASYGALGGTYNALTPSMTLACGSSGKNISTDNISARHLINIKRVARRKMNKCMTCAEHLCCEESITAADIDSRCHNLQDQYHIHAEPRECLAEEMQRLA